MEKRMHGKRILWLLLAALLALAPIALSQKLQVEEYEIYSPKLSGECTLAAISDLHNSFYGEDQGELANAILAAEADALLLVGDMAENLYSCRGVLTLLETLVGSRTVSSAASGSMPAMRVMGRVSSAMNAQTVMVVISLYRIRRLMLWRASSLRPAPMHCPTMVISPRPMPFWTLLLKSSSLAAMACAAMAVVPSVDTED